MESLGNLVEYGFEFGLQSPDFSAWGVCVCVFVLCFRKALELPMILAFLKRVVKQQHIPQKNMQGNWMWPAKPQST